MSDIDDGKFNRVERLTGADGLARLRDARVILFGVGGVGGWTAEALIRSGIGNLTVVDPDVVALSNINRQPMAFVDTVGLPKVEVLAKRLRSINPSANVETLQMCFDASTADSFDLTKYDYIIDAIDSLSDKALLILRATEVKGAMFVSSMGAALKCDPTRVEVAEFWKVSGCPLAAALRRRFKRTGHKPCRKFKAVYSPELLKNRQAPDDESGAMSFNKVVINGALVTVTATVGMTLAALVINHASSLSR